MIFNGYATLYSLGVKGFSLSTTQIALLHIQVPLSLNIALRYFLRDSMKNHVTRLFLFDFIDRYNNCTNAYNAGSPVDAWRAFKRCCLTFSESQIRKHDHASNFSE